MYQHGRRTKAPKSANTLIATLIIMGLVVLGAWWIVHKDIGSNTGPKSTVPIITEVGEDKGSKLQISENFFSMELPADWKLLERRNESYINSYVYASTKKGADDRRLEVHVDIMPQSYKYVKLQPLAANGSKLILGNLSNDCVNFASGANRGSTAPLPAKWENITFTCDPISANQTIGTGSEAGGIKTTLGRHSFFFYYIDHNIRPDDKIFTDALRSFVAK